MKYDDIYNSASKHLNYQQQLKDKYQEIAKKEKEEQRLAKKLKKEQDAIEKERQDKARYAANLKEDEFGSNVNEKKDDDIFKETKSAKKTLKNPPVERPNLRL